MPAKKPDDGRHEVEFDVDASVTDENGKETEAFTAGKKYRLAPDSARRWVRRRKAHYTDKDLQAEFEATL